MVEPEIADDVVLFAPRREVVHHYRRPGCEQSDDLLAVHLGALLAAAVVEEQVERRLRRHQLVPVALEHADVLVFGEELGRGCGELRVDLDRHEGDRGWGAETTQAAPTPQPVPSSPTRVRPRCAARTWRSRPTSGID